MLLADVDEPLDGFDERDPEDAGDMLASHLDRVRATIDRFGGSVLDVIGSRTLAVFGVPRSREDDPERAVRAALAIRDGFSGGRTRARLRLAVATGGALVRPFGGVQQVTGDVVSVCALLLETMPTGAVLVTEATARATERAISYSPGSFRSLHGRAKAVMVRTALAPRNRPGHDFNLTSDAPFVGRAAELRTLLDSFERARNSRQPQLVTLLGVPGIGKTRLVAELRRAVEAGPEMVTWRAGRVLPYSEGMVFQPLAEIVRAEAGIHDADTSEQLTEKIVRAAQHAVPADAAAASWVAGHLRVLVGDAADGTGGDEAPGAKRRDEALAAWRQFLLGLATRRPTILVVEDLHWADDALLDFLDSLVDPVATERGHGAALLLVATGRPQLLERRPGWRGLVTLASLPDTEMTRLLDGLLARYRLADDRAATGGVARDLLARVGGNPLFAEEYVRMLRDRDVVPGQEAVPPASVHTIIAARIDALRPAEKAMLHDAAVFGRSGWPGALAAIGGHDRDDLDARLDSLERKELIRRLGATGAGRDHDSELEFCHILIRDVAYGQIPRLERAGKHQRAAQWLETAQTVDRIERIAHHYQQALALKHDAGQHDAALTELTAIALRNAGDRAAALGVHTTAARHYTAALDLWPNDSPDRPELEFRAGRSLCHAENRGDELLRRARDAFLSANRRERAAEAQTLLGQIANLRGDGQRTAHLERALSLVADAPPSRSKAAVLHGCLMGFETADRHREAISLGQDTLRMARSLGLRDIEAETLGVIGYARVCSGDDHGTADLERCVTILQELGSPHTSRWQMNIADAFAILGDLPRCFAARSAAGTEAERFGAERDLRWIRLELTGEHYWNGNWDDAIRVVDALVAESAQGHGHYLESGCCVWRGRIQLARGEPDAALDDATRALDLARTSGDVQNLDPALAFAARALLTAGRTGEATTLTEELLTGLAGRRLKPDLGVDLPAALTALGYAASALDGVLPSPWLDAARAFIAGDPRQAAAIYARIGSRPDEAYARLEAGRLLLTQDNRTAATVELESALTFYRAVGARTYVAAAESLRDRAARS